MAGLPRPPARQRRRLPGVERCSPASLALVHAAALHAAPRRTAELRLRRDAAHVHHPREHPAAARGRRGVRPLLVRRRGPRAARCALARTATAWTLSRPTDGRGARRARARRAAVASCCSTRDDATLMRARRCSGSGRSRTSRSPTRCCAWRSAARAYVLASLAQRPADGRRSRSRSSSVFDEGARGYVLGNYAASARRAARRCGSCRATASRSAPPRRALAPLLRFGAPTVPADATVFALNVVDRAYLLRVESPAAAGRLRRRGQARARSVIVAVRGFQAAWPPLAYSVADDDEAGAALRARDDGLRRRHRPRRRRRHAARAAGSSTCSPTDQFSEAHEALPWVALGWALYGLVLVLRDDRRPREGDDAQLPGGARRAGRQRRRCSCSLVAAAGHRGRGHRAVRRLRRDARRHPPADAAAVRRAVRVRRGWRAPSLVLAAVGGRRRAAAADRRRRRARAAPRVLARAPPLLVAARVVTRARAPGPAARCARRAARRGRPARRWRSCARSRPAATRRSAAGWRLRPRAPVVLGAASRRPSPRAGRSVAVTWRQ